MERPVGKTLSDLALTTLGWMNVQSLPLSVRPSNSFGLAPSVTGVIDFFEDLFVTARMEASLGKLTSPVAAEVDDCEEALQTFWK